MLEGQAFFAGNAEMKDQKTAKKLERIYNRLLKRLGPQHWWPGDTPFEVMVGAILTQNTSWSNVEKAIRNLKKEKVLSPLKLGALPMNTLRRLIRPSGFFNIKAKRLKNLLNYLRDEYGYDISMMRSKSPEDLRNELLGVSGIGRETADSILLYALQMPVFVVDAYTRRFVSRHGITVPGIEYEGLKNIFVDNLPLRTRLFNEYHALIVSLGKNFCRPKKPLCENCPLNGL